MARVDRRAAGMVLSRKGATSQTQGRKLRSTRTKANGSVVHQPDSSPRAQLESRTRELEEAQRHADEARRQLAEAQRQASEALEQQTATSDVLQVISTSPGDLKPVFETMLESATRICGAKFGMLNLYDGDSFRHVAFHNMPPRYVEARSKPFRHHP